LTKDLHRDAHAAHTTPASPKTGNDTLFRYGFRLWTYLIEALHRVDPAVGARSLAALRAPGVSLLDVLLPVLLKELADLARPVVLGRVLKVGCVP
jgi:hypothetical protein